MKLSPISSSFSYKTLVKDSLPTKPILEMIYTQNDTTFAVVLTLTSARAAVLATYEVSNTMPFLRQQKGQGSDLVTRSSHANVLGLRCLQSRCLLNLCHLVIRWLTMARRNFYQPILVQIYCDSTIMEAWLSFITCRTCILEPQPPHNIADRNCEYC